MSTDKYHISRAVNYVEASRQLPPIAVWQKKIKMKKKKQKRNKKGKKPCIILIALI